MKTLLAGLRYSEPGTIIHHSGRRSVVVCVSEQEVGYSDGVFSIRNIAR